MASRENTKAANAVRELSVCLAISDVVHGVSDRAEHLNVTSDDFYGDGWVYCHEEDLYDQDHPLKVLSVDKLYDKMHGSNLFDIEGGGDPISRRDEEGCAVFYSGKAFCDAIREAGISGTDGEIGCEKSSWREDGLITIAKRNYALGLLIADYFGLYDGALSAIHWMGPENIGGEDRWALPPADIGFKFAGAPRTDYSLYNTEPKNTRMVYGVGGYYDDSEYDYKNAFEDEILEGKYNQEWNHFNEQFKYFDDDYDVLISLKDGSNILANLGFAQFANKMMFEDYKQGTHFFLEYAPNEYDEWFRTALALLIDYISGSDERKDDSDTGTRSVSNYECTQGIIFQEDNDHIILVDQNDNERVIPVNAGYEEYRRLTLAAHRRLFGKWCTDIGNKDDKYIRAQKRCAAKASRLFANSIASGMNIDRVHMLMGWRPAEYYYAKCHSESRDERDPKLSIDLVPSVATMDAFPFDVELDDDMVTVLTDNEHDNNKEGTTEASVTFYLVPLWEREENQPDRLAFKLVMRHSDGMFNTPPKVEVRIEGEAENIYSQLYSANLSDYAAFID